MNLLAFRSGAPCNPSGFRRTQRMIGMEVLFVRSDPICGNCALGVTEVHRPVARKHMKPVFEFIFDACIPLNLVGFGPKILYRIRAAQFERNQVIHLVCVGPVDRVVLPVNAPFHGSWNISDVFRIADSTNLFGCHLQGSARRNPGVGQRLVWPSSYATRAPQRGYKDCQKKFGIHRPYLK